MSRQETPNVDASKGGQKPKFWDGFVSSAKGMMSNFSPKSFSTPTPITPSANPTDLALRRTRSPEELRERMREAWGFGPDPASGGAGGGGEGMAGMGALDHDLLRERERESRGSDASERERPEWRRA
ncbi:hypothetical protein BT69DRAFT_1346270 [Atractiella rhizophila]|nr:hypothetical protein BT69DRAFT_1346270 [Atractiella rhizophila]